MTTEGYLVAAALVLAFCGTVLAARSYRLTGMLVSCVALVLLLAAWQWA